MKVEDFSFGLDENNMEHVEFIENPTKTRQSGLSAKPRSFLPKMFATEMEDVPLQSSKSFYGVVLPNYEQPVHFISLACQIRPRKFGTSGSRWGENKINGMMKSVIEGTSLEDSSKTFANHSARKTVVKKLKTAGLERSSIVKVTGHRNEKSLDDYDEGDESEQRQLSHTISNARNINSQLARGNSSTPVSSSPAVPATSTRSRPTFSPAVTTSTKQLLRFRCPATYPARMISVSVS